MSAARSHAHLLLRGSLALIALLAIWWFFLIAPLRFVLRYSTDFLGGLLFGHASCALITAMPSEDWRFCVPVDIVIANHQRLNSVEFDMAPAAVAAFTFGLPVYWAVMLAAPRIRRWVRPLVLGTALMEVLEVVLLLVLLKINAYTAVARSAPSEEQAINWFLSFSHYLITSVVPYAAPFLIALSLHRELRWQILGRTGADSHPPEDRTADARQRGRRRIVTP